MGKVAFAALFAACVGVCGNAFAADLSLKDTPEYEYAPAPLAWTGFYVGGFLGGAKTDVDIGDTFIYEADPFAANSFDNTGLIGGVEVGYNFQRGNVVLGVAAGLGYLDISGSVEADLPRSIPDDPATDLSAKYETEGGLYGELTGRIGYATDKALFYVKGGAAFVNAEFSSSYTGGNCSTVGGGCGPANPSRFGFSNEETLWGWTVGAGVEYALTSNWSLKAEYQHFDFGTQSFNYAGEFVFNDAGFTSRLTGDTDVDYTVDAVKLGVNYRFNGGDEAIK